MNGAAETPGLLQGLRVLRERWWIILLAAAVTTAVAVAYSVSSQKQYTATSRLLFKESSLPSAVGGPSVTPSSDPEGDKATNAQLVHTTVVAERVRRTLRLPDTPSDLLDDLVVAPSSEGNLVDVAFTDPSPPRAARLANAFADEYVRYAEAQARGKVAAGEELIRQRLADLPPDATEDRKQLRDSLQKLIPIEALQTGDVEVADRAEVPGSPSSPKTKRNGAIALLFGLALGTAIAFLLNLLDRRIKHAEEFEALYDLRSLTSIPERGRAPGSQAERAQALEPFRILRNGLTFLSQGKPLKTVLVTSAVPGEGKSTVAAGLARAVALSGRTCVLVEADLRRPTFAQQFDLGGDVRGLTTALVGGASPESLLREAVPGLRTLRILPSGPLPPNSAELLRSPEMGKLLERLAADADLVILDAPPLLPVADAQVLLDHPQVDAALVVARVYKTTREEARRSRAVIERLRRTNIGLVVNGIRELDRGYDYYGADEPLPAPVAARQGASRLRA